LQGHACCTAQIFDNMTLQRNWQTKVAALNTLKALTKAAPRQIARCLPDIVPRVTESFADAKEQVRMSGHGGVLEAATPRVFASQLSLFAGRHHRISCDSRSGDERHGVLAVCAQVKAAAQAATTECFMVNGNRDIEQFVPALVSCIARPAETTDCIHKLAATTFVQQASAYVQEEHDTGFRVFVVFRCLPALQ
jgi:elongation factor 3